MSGWRTSCRTARTIVITTGWLRRRCGRGRRAGTCGRSGTRSGRSRAACNVAAIRVLFLCTGNSARSIIGAALLKRAGGDAFEVHSAGTSPKGINPYTVRVLQESGIDIAGERSKRVSEYEGQSFDYVITVCDDA